MRIMDYKRDMMMMMMLMMMLMVMMMMMMMMMIINKGSWLCFLASLVFWMSLYRRLHLYLSMAQ